MPSEAMPIAPAYPRAVPANERQRHSSTAPVLFVSRTRVHDGTHLHRSSLRAAPHLPLATVMPAQATCTPGADAAR